MIDKGGKIRKGAGILLIAALLFSVTSCVQQEIPAQSPLPSQPFESEAQEKADEADEETKLMVYSIENDLMSIYARVTYERYGVQVMLPEWSNEMA